MKEAGRTKAVEAAKEEVLKAEPEEAERVLRKEIGIGKALKEKSAADLGEENRICVEKNETIWEKAVKSLKKQ